MQFHPPIQNSSRSYFKSTLKFLGPAKWGSPFLMSDKNRKFLCFLHHQYNNNNNNNNSFLSDSDEISPCSMSKNLYQSEANSGST